MSSTSNQPSATSLKAGPSAQQLVQLKNQRASSQGVQRVVRNSSLSGKASNKKGRSSVKEVRAWLNLVGVLLIPLLIGIYTIVNNNQQLTLAQQQHDSDQRIARQNRQGDIDNQLDQQREGTLKTYEDDISSLLLDRHLRTSQPGDEVRIVALAETLQALHRLDGPRNARAIQYLRDAHLISTIIDLARTDLGQDDLRGANLSNADLSNADLSGANLSGADLSGANLYHAKLRGADLSGAALYSASLSFAFLSSANLSKAKLSDANLSGANLSGANLSKVYLNGANLRGAEVTQQQLDAAFSLKGATMPDGSKHP